MVSIHDVAKRAGVSISTVSNALNGKHNVSEKVRLKIEQLVEEMGYIPNSLAKGLLAGRTGFIGLVVPGTLLPLPYCYALIMQLERYAREAGNYLLLGNSLDHPDQELEVVQSFVSKRIDALIVIPGSSRATEPLQCLYKRVEARGIPVVFLNGCYPEIDGRTVQPDLASGSYDAARYLIGAGHTRFLFVGGATGDPDPAAVGVRGRDERLDGLKTALAEAGLLPESGEPDHLACGYTAMEGYETMRAFLDQAETLGTCQLPTGLLAVNDHVALGAYKALHERGIRVPEDVSLIGYDDLELPGFEAVPLTSVRIPVEELCRVILEHLETARLGGCPPSRVRLKPQLVIRNSTGAFRHSTAAKEERNDDELS